MIVFFLTETERGIILTGCAQPFITSEEENIRPAWQKCDTPDMFCFPKERAYDCFRTTYYTGSIYPHELTTKQSAEIHNPYKTEI